MWLFLGLLLGDVGGFFPELVTVVESPGASSLLAENWNITVWAVILHLRFLITAGVRINELECYSWACNITVAYFDYLRSSLPRWSCQVRVCFVDGAVGCCFGFLACGKLEYFGLAPGILPLRSLLRLKLFIDNWYMSVRRVVSPLRLFVACGLFCRRLEHFSWVCNVAVASFVYRRGL